MRPMLRVIAAAVLFSVFSSTADAQSACTNIVQGAVLTAGQWNQCFQAKQDGLGYTPINQAGGTMTGRLVTTPSTVNRAGFGIPLGVAPSTPVDGDMWLTTSGIFVQVNGSTVGPLTSSAGFSLLVGTTPISGGTSNGLIYNSSGKLGNLASANNGVVVTDGGGVPSVASTLPSGLTIPTPVLSGLSTGTCANGIGIDSGNHAIKTPCSSVAVGSTSVTSGTSGAFLYNNGGTLANASPATKSDQQTGTSTTAVVTPSQQQSHDSAAKAWAYVTQSAGTYTLVANYNVASVSKTSTGRLTVNLTTAFANANFACTATPDGTRFIVTTPASSSSVSISLNDSSTAAADSGFSIVCYGRQ